MRWRFAKRLEECYFVLLMETHEFRRFWLKEAVRETSQTAPGGAPETGLRNSRLDQHHCLFDYNHLANGKSDFFAKRQGINAACWVCGEAF